MVLSQHTIRIGLRLLLVGLPAVYVLNLVFSASDLPQYDYWGNLRLLYASDNSGALTPMSQWFSIRNGHPFLVPRLIYLANVYGSGGSNFYLSLWVFRVFSG